jgi:2-polyprenyl-6-methoxyphenol hydroxylase-like FAD-dependent oxidoreductase
MPDTQVLIVGAGPTGLALALWLSHLGVKVRLIEQATQPGVSSRALAVQARTLELYRQVGLAQAVVDRGHRVAAVNLWVRARRAARVPFQAIGQGLSPFPFALVFPQDEHEQLLAERLATRGIEVERGTELVDFEDRGRMIHARLRKAGAEQTCAAEYVAGCDGAHSRVRQSLGIAFPGGTYQHLFYVADVQASGPSLDGELHVDLDEADFLAIFPLKGTGRARLIGTVRDQRAQHPEQLRFEDVSDRAISHLRVEVARVNWFSTYRVHHRVAPVFCKGRAFLLGDAAHIHSPAGGQGLNTGIGDAVNLAWKLAAAIRGGDSTVLASYEPERIAFARRLVATTDRAFTAATSPGPTARLLRTEVVPRVAPLLGLAFVRRFAFRTVSQIAVQYRDGPLSSGAAGPVHGGDRLPWICAADTEDNFTPLNSISWQVHVYGEPRPEIRQLCAARVLPLHRFAWQAQWHAAGLRRDALYLVRPDGYLALVDEQASAQTLGAYLDRVRPWLRQD